VAHLEYDYRSLLNPYVLEIVTISRPFYQACHGFLAVTRYAHVSKIKIGIHARKSYFTLTYYLIK